MDEKRITFHLYHTNGVGYRKNKDSFTDDPTAQEDPNSLGVGENTLTIFNPNTKARHTLRVESITYHKQLYYPGEITITMTADTTKASDLLSDVRNHLKDTFVDLCDRVPQGKSHYIAQNYYVHSVKVEIKAKRTIQLHCKSLDALLDIKPYSKTYQGPFATKVLPTLISEIQDKVPQLQTDTTVDRLCHLSYKSNDQLQELHQPYLVQYNETFHAFARRVAYRCGEMLYYEHGKWNIGLSPATRDILANKNQLPATIQGDIHSQDSDIAQSPIDVALYAPDYTSTATPSSQNYYTSPTTNDEYMHTLTESDQCTPSDGYNVAKLIVNTLSGFFSGSTYTESITNSVKNAAVDTTFWVAPILGLRDVYKDEFKTLKAAQDANGLTPSQTNDTDKTKNLFNAYYAHVAERQRAALSTQVIVSHSDNTSPVHLGDAVKISDPTGSDYSPGTLYIITEMQGAVSCDPSTHKLIAHHHIHAIPGSSPDNIYPPHTPHIDPIRHTGPLQAIVIDNADPLRMNRVRVKYPWDSGSKQSPWLRVSQPYVEESLGGFNFMLQVGSSVMLSYEDNNIERPYVDGTMLWKPKQAYVGEPSLEKNANHANIQHLLIAHNGQYIKFTDTLGQYANSNAAGTFVSNLIPPLGLVINSINAISSASGSSFEIGKGDKRWAGGVEIGDALGIYRIKGSTTGRNITIESPCGTININAFTGITISAPNGDVKIAGKNITLEAGNNVTIKSGSNITTYSENEADTTRYATKAELVGGIASSVGAAISKSVVDASLMRDIIGMPIDTTKILDVSFLRSTWECLMRPVEGTATLKSKRNMLIEVGNGKAIIPKSRLATTKDSLTNSGGQTIVEKARQESQQTDHLKSALMFLEEVYINNCFNRIEERHNAECTLITTLQTQLTTDEWGTLDGNWAAWNTPMKVLNQVATSKTLPDHQDAPDSQKTILQKLSRIIAPPYQLPPLIEEEYHDAFFEPLNGYLRNTKGAKDIEDKITETATHIKERINVLQDELFNHLNDGDTLAELQARTNTITQKKKDMKRQLLYEAATQWTDQFEVMQRDTANPETWHPVTLTPNDYSDDQSWQTFYENLRPKLSHDNGFGTNLLSGLKHIGDDLLTNFAGPEGDRFGLASWNTLLNRHGEAGPRAYSDVAQNGGTLVISNTQDKTIELTETGTQWQSNDNPLRETFLSYIRIQALNSLIEKYQ